MISKLFYASFSNINTYFQAVLSQKYSITPIPGNIIDIMQASEKLTGYPRVIMLLVVYSLPYFLKWNTTIKGKPRLEQ